MTAPTQEVTGNATKLGPFKGGLHNSSGSGEFIKPDELFECINLEVDTDGSLVNRPQINKLTLSGITVAAATGMSFIGTYLPSDGRKFIVANIPVDNKVVLIDVATGIVNAIVAAGVSATCCIQYANKLFVVADNGSASNGGFFDAPTVSTITWTTVVTMPKGQAVTQYRERLWIACGLSAVSNTSRFFFSAVGDPGAAWAGGDYIDVVPGNGQKLVSLVRLGNDIVLFKEHSTHKFTYASDPRKAELVEVDATIGCPAINCVVVYDNGTIFVLHDDSVYELYQYTYTDISDKISMDQVTDLSMYANSQYGLTLHRNRLFVRFYSNLYVYSLKTKTWSEWQSTRKFSKVVVIPSATVGLDTAYAASSSSDTPGEGFYFQDNRRTLEIGEVFKCSLKTKTYDFDIPESFKVLFWYGLSVATSGVFTSTMLIPNAKANLTWNEAKALYGSWDAAKAAGITWSNNVSIEIIKVISPTLGKYARKFIKLPRKTRFRQVSFSLVFDIISNNGVGDASLRVFDLTIFVKQKQGVVKETS